MGKSASVLAVILLLPIIVWFYPFKSASKAYEGLALGSSYDELISLAGRPSYETDGTKWVEPEYKKSHDQLIDGCVRELWYESIIKLPSKYAFCFNQNNQLIDKYHWVSW